MRAWSRSQVWSQVWALVWVLVWGVVLAGGGKAAGAQGRGVTIVLVGDSTVATEGGWGPGFCALMSPRVTCLDDALNGRSTKSFVDEGAWKKALDRHGDYYLIQFGHNDQKVQPAVHTDADSSFQTYLRRYIADVRALGATPVLVTSLSRRNYREGVLVEDLTPYVEATKKVGADESVAVIDLNAISTRMLKGMTQAEADRFDKGNDPATGKLLSHAAEDGVTQTASGVDAARPEAMDRTHLNAYGQKVFGRIVAEQLVRVHPELRPYVSQEVGKTSATP